MRFIDRKALLIPDILYSKEIEKAREEVREFIELTQSEGSTRRVPDWEWLSYDKQLMFHMERQFSGVCAYCESPPHHDSDYNPSGYFHLHRPGTFAADEDGKTDILSYCWLIYEWDNWLHVCDVCSRQKANRFYVQQTRGSVGMAIEELREFEQENMLDPCFHDPASHLRFQMNGTVEWTSPQGHAITDILDLNRQDLVVQRKEANAHLLSLLESKAPLTVFRTGAPSRMSSYVFADLDDSNGNANSPSLLPYTGAVTNALLGLAREMQLVPGGANELLEVLRVEQGSSLVDKFFSSAHQLLETNDDFQDETRIEIAGSVQRFQGSGNEAFDPAFERPARQRVPNVKYLRTAEAQLCSVSIRNFKALSEIRFTLPKSVESKEQVPCMLLLGENATGKSSVLESMTLAIIGALETSELNDILRHESLEPRELIHIPDLTNPDLKGGDVSISLEFLDTKETSELFASSQDGSFNGSEHTSKVVLAYGPRRFFSKGTRRWRAPAYRVRSMFDPMAMIANPIEWIKGLSDKDFEPVARALRQILMLENSDDFTRANEGDERGQILVRQNGQTSALKDLSVGYKSVIALTCDIMRELLYHYDNFEFAHAIVFIDEIETHLHPRWKMQIMSLLRKAFPKVQFIVTTHDPLCLRGMYDGEVFVLTRSEDTAQVEQVKELPSIRGMRTEQILTSEFFGLGSTDPETDARLIRYNRLVARIEDLSERERLEMEELGKDLENRLVMGDNKLMQAYAEVLKERAADKRNINPSIPSASSKSTPARRDLKTRFSALFDDMD